MSNVKILSKNNDCLLIIEQNF